MVNIGWNKISRWAARWLGEQDSRFLFSQFRIRLFTWFVSQVYFFALLPSSIIWGIVGLLSLATERVSNSKDSKTARGAAPGLHPHNPWPVIRNFQECDKWSTKLETYPDICAAFPSWSLQHQISQDQVTERFRPIQLRAEVRSC